MTPEQPTSDQRLMELDRRMAEMAQAAGTQAEQTSQANRMSRKDKVLTATLLTAVAGGALAGVLASNGGGGFEFTGLSSANESAQPLVATESTLSDAVSTSSILDSLPTETTIYVVTEVQAAPETTQTTSVTTPTTLAAPETTQTTLAAPVTVLETSPVSTILASIETVPVSSQPATTVLSQAETSVEAVTSTSTAAVEQPAARSETVTDPQCLEDFYPISEGVWPAIISKRCDIPLGELLANNRQYCDPDNIPIGSPIYLEPGHDTPADCQPEAAPTVSSGSDQPQAVSAPQPPVIQFQTASLGNSEYDNYVRSLCADPSEVPGGLGGRVVIPYSTSEHSFQELVLMYNGVTDEFIVRNVIYNGYGGPNFLEDYGLDVVGSDPECIPDNPADLAPYIP